MQKFNPINQRSRLEMWKKIVNIFTSCRQLHWPEYGAEFLGTLFNIFVGFSAIVFNFGKGLPMEHLIPDRGIRLLCTALVFAGSGSLFAISPLGKLSGAHLNPCLSLAFWLQGKMYFRDIIGYIIAQFLGATMGALLVSVVWGSYAVTVHNGMTIPGSGHPLWYVFLVEIVITGLLVLSIFIFLSSHRLMHWTPLLVWLLVVAIVLFAAPITGASLNTARSIGPAIVIWHWTNQWIYCIAPPLGALAAVGVFRLLVMGERELLTGKLFHVPHYRCIFKKVRLPHLSGNTVRLYVLSDRDQDFNN